MSKFDELNEANYKKVNIKEIIKNKNYDFDHIELYGDYIAKVNANIDINPQSKLIVVTAMTPTVAGEGKTTTTISLVDAFNALNKRAIGALREPSLGPVFGSKGGATGGGLAQITPAEDINLHFTGDFHAITSANNLIVAMLENEIHFSSDLNIDPSKGILWKRCIDMNDRGLRNINVKLSKDVDYQTGFNITAASDLMALLCLCNNQQEFIEMIEATVIAYKKGSNQKPITIGDLNITNAIMKLLKKAFNPNVVQTIEGNLVLIHGGPFANIAHGCNSIIATKTGLHVADYVITECGFGSDLGLEKFMDIKAQQGNLKPNLVVLTISTRSLKMHANVAKENLSEINCEALIKGFDNVLTHIRNIKNYHVPCIISINKFAGDKAEELECIKKLCEANKIPVSVNDAWSSGSAGALDLAKQMIALIAKGNDKYKSLYKLDDSIENKILTIAKKAYGSKNVIYSIAAKDFLKHHNHLKYYVCMAKTPLSITDDPTIKGGPSNFTIHIESFEINHAAKLIIPILGKVFRLPGLAKNPSAKDM